MCVPGKVLGGLCLLALALTGCGSDEQGAWPLLSVWGGPGAADGEFRQPRAIGFYEQEVYVIDKTGRVQVFTEEGQFLRSWKTPDASNGTPTGMVFTCEGTVVVPDTHYSRILEYDTQGALLTQWGSFGTGESEFIYPTDLALGQDGFHFISEYGTGAERVHVFDADRHFARQWGAKGEAPGQFSRAMSIAVDETGRVFVCDTANHRVQCFQPDGTLVRVIGGPGAGPGQLKFPYDIALVSDQTLLVCEYGNNRLSRFDAEGAFIESFGRPGRAKGQFHAPRGVCVNEAGVVFVADTGNNRIQSFQLTLKPVKGGSE